MGKCTNRWVTLIKILVAVAACLLLLRVCLELATNVKPVVMRLAGFYRKGNSWEHCWFLEEEAEEPVRDASSEAKHVVELAKLRDEVHSALGSESRARTQKDISEFLASFNACKLDRGLSDTDLTRTIMAEIKPWGIFSKLRFKFLVDAYKRAHPSKKKVVT